LAQSLPCCTATCRTISGVMGKRAAAKVLASPSKAKVAKVDEFVEECQPVGDLIIQADIPEGCRDMLLSMAPFCLRGSPGGRHQFQHRMAEAIQKVASDIESSKTAGVQEAELAVQEVASQQAEIAGKLAAATSVADEARAHRTAKDEALSAARKAESEAAAAVSAAKESVAALEAEQAETVSEKAEYEQLVADTWSTLKACAIPGQKWRERVKVIKVMLDMLKKIGLSNSLEGALPVALKLKPEDRGPFAVKTVEYAEALVQKHLSSLATKLTNFEAGAATRAQAVKEAEDSLKSATEQKSKCQDDCFSAENDLLEKDEALSAEKKIEASLSPKALEAHSHLQAANQSLADVKTLIAQFVALRDHEKEALPTLQADRAESTEA